jgi:DNA processing protein
LIIERKISTYTLEELVGPLNDVEKKYAPKQLYVVGRLPIPLPSPRVAVIGSRKASIKGLTAASNIARILAEHKVIVVSGLAEGIDTAAHNGAIKEFIMQKHMAISQFPVGYPIQPKNFVIRNRTMALIADASIIVEAGNSSGSLHQGWEALRLGRPLFIWSPLMHVPSLNWPEKMAMYGAMEFNDPEEVLDELPSRQRILEVIA